MYVYVPQTPVLDQSYRVAFPTCGDSFAWLQSLVSSVLRFNKKRTKEQKNNRKIILTAIAHIDDSQSSYSMPMGMQKFKAK